MVQVLSKVESLPIHPIWCLSLNILVSTLKSGKMTIKSSSKLQHYQVSWWVYLPIPDHTPPQPKINSKRTTILPLYLLFSSTKPYLNTTCVSCGRGGVQKTWAWWPTTFSDCQVASTSSIYTKKKNIQPWKMWKSGKLCVFKIILTLFITDEGLSRLKYIWLRMK